MRNNKNFNSDKKQQLSNANFCQMQDMWNNCLSNQQVAQQKKIKNL